MTTKKGFKHICITLAGCLLILTGCEPDILLPDQPVDQYTQVYMPAAVNGPVIKTLKIKDSVQTVIYGANYGGVGYPDEDVQVSFMIDNSKVDSFNLANGFNLPLLPANSYTMSATTAVIPKGKLSTAPLNISFKTTGPDAMVALKIYLLPVTITSSSVTVNESLRTTFFIIQAQPDLNDYPVYDRTGWQVIDFSSEEAVGEGPDNGHAIHMLDGNNNSFWHTQWKNGSPGPPHHFTIDMGEVKTLHGLSFLGRQSGNNGKPHEISIEVSENNVDWTDAGSLDLQNTLNLQPEFLPEGFQPARYFKVIIHNAYNASYSHLAEIYAF